MTAEKVMAAARAEIGTKESPAGSNTVKYNTDYYGRRVSGASYPWCCVFLWWVFRAAGASSLFFGGGKTASCPALREYYIKHGAAVQKAAAGDVVFFDFSGAKTRAQHVGLVTAVSGDTITTVEGNTGSGNDANGGAVMERRRKMSSVSAIVRPEYNKEEEMTQQQFNDMMEKYLEARDGKAVSDYAENAWSKATKAGTVNGASPRGFLTREQFITVLGRLKLID